MSNTKEQMRKRLKSLSFTEKIRILEKLRDRSRTLAASGLRPTSSAEQTHAAKQKTSAGTKEE